MILSLFLRTMIADKKKTLNLIQQNNYQEIMFKAFLDFHRSETPIAFIQKATKWTSEIFQTSKTRFYIKQNDKLRGIDQSFDIKEGIGVIGEVFKNK